MPHLSSKTRGMQHEYSRGILDIGHFHLLGLVPDSPIKLPCCQSSTIKALPLSINTIWLYCNLLMNRIRSCMWPARLTKWQLLEALFAPRLHDSLVFPSLPWARQPWPGICSSRCILPTTRRTITELMLKWHKFWDPRNHRPWIN